MNRTHLRILSISLLSSSLFSGSFLAAIADETSDGVTIKRNSDGTVEVFDSSDSAPTPLHSGTGSSKRSASRSTGRSGQAMSGTRRYSDVVVKRNPDGTVETYDAGDSYVSSGRQAGGSRYRPGTSNIGGVTVKRNPDGTIETYDSDVPARSTVRATSKTHGARRPATKARAGSKRGASNMGGVYVKRNPDGTIETFDAN